jgi:ribosomal subunit interface protein
MMSVDVTTRHMESKEEERDYAQEKGDEMMASFPGVEHIHVVLDVVKYLFETEVIVQASKHVRVEATESSDNLRTSIDAAFGKVEKQLRKVSDKAHDHRSREKIQDVQPEVVEEDSEPETPAE